MLLHQVKYILLVSMHNTTIWVRLQSVPKDNSKLTGKKQTNKFYVLMAFGYWLLICLSWEAGVEKWQMTSNLARLFWKLQNSKS